MREKVQGPRKYGYGNRANESVIQAAARTVDALDPTNVKAAYHVFGFEKEQGMER